MPPVIGRKIRAPDLHTQRARVVLDRFGAHQPGDAHERGKRSVIAQGRLYRGNAVVDFLPARSIGMLFMLSG